MLTLTRCASLLGLVLFLIMSAGSANAQATRTWVSGVGDDANPCSRTAPCKTFAGAISKYAKGATGNVATEDVVHLLHGLGAETGIALDALVDCGAWISAALGRENGSRAGRALLARRSTGTPR
jgi:hypothetical protein